MRIPECDMKYIVLSVYLLTLTSPIRHKMDHTRVNLIQLKTFKLELDFAEYIHSALDLTFLVPLTSEI